MNNQVLKNELIEWLTKTNDRALLNALKSIKDSAAANQDWFDKLTNSEQESLNRGVADHEKGDVLSGKDFWSGFDSKI